MDPKRTKHILEACLLVAARPLSVAQLEALFADDGERPTREGIRAALDALREDYAERAIELVEVASGYRLQSRAEVQHWVSRLFQEKTPRYSRALLETLVLVAYRQPITRGEIEEVRGVAVSSNIVRTLQERQWVREVGYKDVPGRPALLGTTRQFLDYFNLKRLEDLPTLGELKDLDAFDAVLAGTGLVDGAVDGTAANDAGEGGEGGVPPTGPGGPPDGPGGEGRGDAPPEADAPADDDVPPADDAPAASDVPAGDDAPLAGEGDGVAGGSDREAPDAEEPDAGSDPAASGDAERNEDDPPGAEGDVAADGSGGLDPARGVDPGRALVAGVDLSEVDVLLDASDEPGTLPLADGSVPFDPERYRELAMSGGAGPSLDRDPGSKSESDGTTDGTTDGTGEEAGGERAAPARPPADSRPYEDPMSALRGHIDRFAAEHRRDLEGVGASAPASDDDPSEDDGPRERSVPAEPPDRDDRVP